MGRTEDCRDEHEQIGKSDPSRRGAVHRRVRHGARTGRLAPVLPKWMVGCWETRSGLPISVECWSKPDGPVMRGESISGSGGKTDEHEKMEIVHAETDDPAIPWHDLLGQAL